MRADAAEFELVRPGSLAGVLRLLAERPGEYLPIAGGTEVMVQFGAGRLRARRLVDIFGLPELTRVEVAEREITLGAGVTYSAIRRDAVLAQELPLLAVAASWTGAIANQNRGTLGGNIVNGSPAADTPPALLAYGAELSLVSVRGVRRVDYAEFHTGYKRSVLAADELVLAVHLPRAAYTHGYLRKVGARAAQAISKVALGAVANLVDGRVRDCRVGLASVASGPFRCRAVEAALDGSVLDERAIAAARAALRGEIAPLDDIRSTAEYRVQVAGNLLEEFLRQLWAKGEAEKRLKLAGGKDEEGGTERLAQISDAVLLACCGSSAWVDGMMAGRPFGSAAELLGRASAVWTGLEEADWLEAFACHPRIGERREGTTEFLTRSAGEQAAAQASLAEVAERLAEGNRSYEARFGFLYIVFADGRSAPELLAVLEERLGHTRAEELQEAARQQDRITRLRLERWLAA